MMSISRYFSLIVLLALLAFSAVGAATFSSDEFKYRITVPDNIWSRDTTLERSGRLNEIRAFHHISEKNAYLMFTAVTVLPDQQLDNNFIAEYLRGAAPNLRILDSSTTTWGGRPAFRYRTVMEKSGMKVWMAGWITLAGGHGYSTTLLYRGDAPADSAVMRDMDAVRNSLLVSAPSSTETQDHERETPEAENSRPGKRSSNMFTPEWWGARMVDAMVLGLLIGGVFFIRSRSRKNRDLD
ncbi:MAG: hypothetical protein ABI876_00335 [Bacteroidota bacterium]